MTLAELRAFGAALAVTALPQHRTARRPTSSNNPPVTNERCAQGAIDRTRSGEHAADVTDRRIPTAVEGDRLWECSHDDCDFAVSAPDRPPNHDMHPDDAMVEMVDTA